MHKCQHGQKITMFCATDCCVWKEAGGCQTCIKKYHNHMGTTVFLSEQEVNTIVKKYTMDSNIKPKCRVLQEAIYSYFTLIKTEITSSIEIACKNIINQIGYPYLYANNALSTYKKLKNKEYKKIGQKDFKFLYDLTQKVTDKELANEQTKIYLNQMKLTEQLINGLQESIKNYENLIKKYNPAFVHDVQHIIKINQIFKNLNYTQSPRPKAKDQKKPEEKKTVSPTYQFKEKLQAKEKLTKLEEIKSIQLQRTNIAMPSALAKPNYSRDVSIDKKIIKQPRFGGVTPRIQKKGGQKQQIQLKNTPIQRQKSEKIQAIKHQLNSKELEINEKKKMLMQMMKQKQDTFVSYPSDMIKKTSVDSYRTQIDQIVNTQSSQKKRIPTEPAFSEKFYYKEEKSYQKQPLITSKRNEFKAYNQDKIGIDIRNIQETKSNRAGSSDKSEKGSNQQLQQQSHRENNGTKNYAFTRLPVEQPIFRQMDREKVSKKLVVIPNMTFRQNENEEVASPILKKSFIDRYRQSIRMTVSIVNDKETKQETKVEKARRDNQKLLSLTAAFSKKTEPLLQLRQNQEISLALLLKSLPLKAEQAIIYLEKAIKQAENNLSAVQYLTFLYLQLDRPLDCLKLCNKMLEKLENTSEPDDLSLIINNNKAAALNILGRYSESIVLLQKCLRHREKDYFYKNLGDAYFSISIYEKASYNYEKALKLNDQHDQAHYNLAVCQYGQQNYHNAKLSIEKAIEINSMNEQYHELLTNIKARMDNY